MTSPQLASHHRRADFDVTDSVQVTSAAAVCQSVQEIFCSLFDKRYFSAIKQSFEDFDKLFDGDYEGYQACDTFYHDKQHTLDMTLAMARLIEGYQHAGGAQPRFEAEHAVIGIITALFHDAGYIRELGDSSANGAVYTMIHVSRSAQFLKKYLPTIGLEAYTEIAANVVHYTGYELKPGDISLPEPRWHLIGHLLGSADLIAQMSDRCYLEKCRDRLYPEFVLGNIAETTRADGSKVILYHSGEDLLQKTPAFYDKELNSRLNQLFGGVYKYAATHFGQRNLYVEALEANIEYLKKLIREDKLDQLQRIPLMNQGAQLASTSSSETIRRLAIR